MESSLQRCNTSANWFLHCAQGGLTGPRAKVGGLGGQWPPSGVQGQRPCGFLYLHLGDTQWKE